MEEELSNQNIAKRPLSLTILCILTFISAGMGIISSLITPLFSDVMIEFLKSNPKVDEKMMDEPIHLLNAGWGYYMLTLLFVLGSLTGAILMWKLKKTGIHFYALSNLALLFVPTLMLSIPLNWMSILLTSGFIALYASHLKLMK
jgi:hypothetical protein